jgi:hypothetical protein
MFAGYCPMKFVPNNIRNADMPKSMKIRLSIVYSVFCCERQTVAFSLTLADVLFAKAGVKVKA